MPVNQDKNKEPKAVETCPFCAERVLTSSMLAARCSVHRLCKMCREQTKNVACPLCQDAKSKKEEEDPDEEDLCSICLDKMLDPVSLNCKHQFCHACLTDWKQRSNSTCPLCRTPITSIRAVEFKLDPKTDQKTHQKDKQDFKVKHADTAKSAAQMQQQLQEILLGMNQDARRCHGIVKTGPRRGMGCLKRPQIGSQFCHLHAPKPVAVVT